jgi:hypothetical protein
MRALLFFGLVLLGACGGPRLVHYERLEKQTDIDQKKLYDAAEGTLLDRGYLIEKRDEGAFTLVTKPRTVLGSEIGKSKFKYAFEVKTSDGKLRIELSCRQEGGLGDPGDCEKETPEKVVEEQNAIAEQAVREAKGQ